MDKQRKIDALKNMARSGTKHEAAIAMSILERLNIDLQEEEPIELFNIDSKTEYEWDIFRQTAAMILDTRDLPLYVGKGRGKKKRFIKCTKGQFSEIELFYGLYKRALNDELDITVQAFIQKNSIFPSEVDTATKMTDEIRKVIRRADSVDRVTIRKQIASNA